MVKKNRVDIVARPATDTRMDDDDSIIECDCCGQEAGRGEVEDGQPLACGCAGRITVDGEQPPDTIIDGECPPTARCNVYHGDYVPHGSGLYVNEEDGEYEVRFHFGGETVFDTVEVALAAVGEYAGMLAADTGDRLEHWRKWTELYDPFPEQPPAHDNERRVRVNWWIEMLTGERPRKGRLAIAATKPEPQRLLVEGAAKHGLEGLWAWDTTEHVNEIRRLRARVVELEVAATDMDRLRHALAENERKESESRQHAIGESGLPAAVVPAHRVWPNLRDAAREYAETWEDYRDGPRQTKAQADLEVAARAFVAATGGDVERGLAWSRERGIMAERDDAIRALRSTATIFEELARENTGDRAKAFGDAAEIAWRGTPHPGLVTAPSDESFEPAVRLPAGDVLWLEDGELRMGLPADATSDSAIFTVLVSARLLPFVKQVLATVGPPGVWRCPNGHECDRIKHRGQEGPCITCGEPTTWHAKSLSAAPESARGIGAGLASVMQADAGSTIKQRLAEHKASEPERIHRWWRETVGTTAVLAAWDRGDLSEGQAADMLGLDRVAAREALDSWRLAQPAEPLQVLPTESAENGPQNPTEAARAPAATLLTREEAGRVAALLSDHCCDHARSAWDLDAIASRLKFYWFIGRVEHHASGESA